MEKSEASLATQPDSSRRAAVVIQGMPPQVRFKFVEALEKATKIGDLPEPYKGYMKNGYKADNG
jgi:hypothetical protein